MREGELRKHAKCNICGCLIGHTGLPLFWTVIIERHGIKTRSVKRQDGLAAMLGSPMLAHVMGADEDMTETLCGPITLALCEKCAIKNDICITALAEGE